MTGSSFLCAVGDSGDRLWAGVSAVGWAGAQIGLFSCKLWSLLVCLCLASIEHSVGLIAMLGSDIGGLGLLGLGWEGFSGFNFDCNHHFSCVNSCLLLYVFNLLMSGHSCPVFLLFSLIFLFSLLSLAQLSEFSSM